MLVFVKSMLISNNFINRICNTFIDCVVLYMKCSMFRDMRDIIIYIASVSPEGITGKRKIV